MDSPSEGTGPDFFASYIFFFKIFFLIWTIFKTLLNLLLYCIYFMFWCFDPEACGILVPQPGIEPTPPELAGRS